MKATILLLVFGVAVTVAQQYFTDEKGFRRTTHCNNPSRRKRQAQPKTTICWFPAGTATSADDCEALSESGKRCKKTPIFRPLGDYNVCAKSDVTGKWHFTEGSNGFCGGNGTSCCEWYPPTKCNPLDSLLEWFEKPAGADSCNNVENPKINVAPGIIEGADYDIKTVCIRAPSENEEEVVYVEEKVELLQCAEGCCVFSKGN
jgi:hypothetical protein